MQKRKGRPGRALLPFLRGPEADISSATRVKSRRRARPLQKTFVVIPSTGTGLLLKLTRASTTPPCGKREMDKTNFESGPLSRRVTEHVLQYPIFQSVSPFAHGFRFRLGNAPKLRTA